ncbi:MAG TPA: hypothetical protein VJ227_02990 [Patescibacteria group bacterium]|nr:hypothetical protein [Patescibacteria group bacterium]
MERDKRVKSAENPYTLRSNVSATEILRSLGVTNRDLVEVSIMLHETNPKLYPKTLKPKGREHRATEREIKAFFSLREP